MKLNDIKVTGGPLVPVKRSDVTDLESELWFEFPGGYSEYVTKLGDGILSTLIRIYPPLRIKKELAEWRRRIDKYWFWDRGKKLLPKARALECIIVGDTLNGDELVFHPHRPGQLFVLPRDSENIFDAGPDLISAIDWLCESGKIAEKIPERVFEPTDSRSEQAPRRGKSDVVDPPGESLDEIVELAKRWGQRHAILRFAKKNLGLNKGQIAELQCLAVAFQGKYLEAHGCVARFDVTDDATGLDLGTVYWHFDDGSYGSEFRWNEANLAKVRKRQSGKK
jgi:hypothetical protein